MHNEGGRIFHIRNLRVFLDLRSFMGIFIFPENARGIYDVAEFFAKKWLFGNYIRAFDLLTASGNSLGSMFFNFRFG